MAQGKPLSNRKKQSIVRHFKTHTAAVTASLYGVAPATVRTLWKLKNGSCKLKGVSAVINRTDKSTNPARVS